MKNEPMTPDEQRDIARRVENILNRCDEQLRNYVSFYNSTRQLEDRFSAQISLLNKIIVALIWMVFLAMIMNIGTVGVLLWLWLHK